MKKINEYFAFAFAIVAIFFVSNFLITSMALAAVDKIVFINEPQTILVGSSSLQYQIQLQNSAGEIQEAPFTIYFSLPLELGTFSSQKDGTPFTASTSVYIATKSSNKYFYFKSNTVGNYLLKVIATNKDKTQSWTAEQVVTISEYINNGGGAGTTTDFTISTSTATSTASTTVIVPANPDVISVHYNQESLSNYNGPKNIFEVFAGRDRISHVNSPVSFEAKYNSSLDQINMTPNYTWTFGDGGIGTGDDVIHTYKYAGEYNVVLNANLGKLISISRVKVKILKPDLLVSVLNDGAVEIYNKGNSEINLYSFSLKSQNLTYSFPIDTIISANKTVTFPVEYLKIPTLGNQITLIDASGLILKQGDIKNLAMNNIDNNDHVITVADFQKFALVYKDLVEPTVSQTIYTNSIVKTADTLFEPEIAKVEPDISLAASAPLETPGFWSKLFHRKTK